MHGCTYSSNVRIKEKHIDFQLLLHTIMGEITCEIILD